MVKLLINLYEECNLQQEIPQLIPKTIMVVLSAKMASGEIELTQEHKELALSKIPSARGELLFDFVYRLKIIHLVNEEYYRNLAL